VLARHPDQPVVTLRAGVKRRRPTNRRAVGRRLGFDQIGAPKSEAAETETVELREAERTASRDYRDQERPEDRALDHAECIAERNVVKYSLGQRPLEVGGTVDRGHDSPSFVGEGVKASDSESRVELRGAEPPVMAAKNGLAGSPDFGQRIERFRGRGEASPGEDQKMIPAAACRAASTTALGSVSKR